MGGRLLRFFHKRYLFIEISDSDGMHVPDDAFVPVLSLTAASFLSIPWHLSFPCITDPRAFSTSDNPHL
jgi:hypothetical protein